MAKETPPSVDRAAEHATRTAGVAKRVGVKGIGTLLYSKPAFAALCCLGNPASWVAYVARMLALACVQDNADAVRLQHPPFRQESKPPTPMLGGKRTWGSRISPESSAAAVRHYVFQL